MTYAKLPLMFQPEVKLTPNRSIALKVLNQQIKKLSRIEKDKSDVVASEEKLQKLGHVAYVKDLPQEVQQMLDENKVKNYIPWRSVWKENSFIHSISYGLRCISPNQQQKQSQ